ncbi:hypothetical protein GGR50DRAFT_306742 [Xylaria sp. CBS 124048]|nr:hypothetical protein GGR50DRAFT_306742 [Xylaria sp. CBS 124048]
MPDHHFTSSVGPHGAIRPRPPPLRATSPSPSRQQRSSDNLLSQLTPESAVKALQSPTGSLKACLDRASALEQAFALKTAVTSKTIHDWLEELSSWPWPSEGTATGFETSPSKKRRSLEHETSRGNPETTHNSGISYFGSLPADCVVRYEQRIEQINRDMEGLKLEEIKNQVLHNHILPLSRPGTPYSDSGRSGSSAFTFSRMEDLTAVVTAITVRTLPALSKLSRLLHTWSVRLVVLRKVPSFLTMIADAEAALRSGWGTIDSMPNSSSTRPISQKDIDVIKSVLQRKVAKSGQNLDFMLDTLEGMADTLPDEWLDRMDSLERDCAKWITAAERKMKETEWSKSQDHLTEHADPKLSQLDIPIQDAKPANIPMSISTPDYESLAEQDRESWAVKILPDNDLQKGITELHGPISNQSEDVQNARRNPGQNGILSETNRNIARLPVNLLKPSLEEDFEPSVLESVNEEDEELELPPIYPQTRKGSDSSVATTILHGSSNFSPAYYDNGVFYEASVQPESPQLPGHYEQFSSDAVSPPSSPPLRYQFRSSPTTFKDIPQLPPLPDVDNSPPRGVLGPPVVFDPDSSFDWDSQHDSPNMSSSISDDDHLQKQLRELLETIPARIELKRRLINLNPPDFQLPSRPKPTRRRSDASRRPNSAFSSRESRVTTPSYSRSATPSFMLAPVRDTRPRSTSSQGIRLYHLTRSGERPIKLFIRCVGEHNERVMVRVGGGWSDLGEYLRAYAIHHGSRSKGEGKVEVTDAAPASSKHPGSSPISRPSSAQNSSPMSPLAVRKTRTNSNEESMLGAPRTPLGNGLNGRENGDTPGSGSSTKSGVSSNIDWDEEDSALGLAGPKATKRKDISAESRAWIESVKAKVRMASTERIAPSRSAEQLRPAQPSVARTQKQTAEDRFGEMGRAGATKRLFKKN